MGIVSLYHRHRFPSEIISHCVWLYFRFSLSFRDVEELMASRGVSFSYETVREWCFKFGQTYANRLRRRSPRFSLEPHKIAQSMRQGRAADGGVTVAP